MGTKRGAERLNWLLHIQVMKSGFTELFVQVWTDVSRGEPPGQESLLIFNKLQIKVTFQSRINKFPL